MPDASRGAEGGGVARPGALAGRVRRAAAVLVTFAGVALAAIAFAAPALAQTLSVGIESDGTGDATGVEGDSLTFTVKMSATKGSNVTLKWRFVAGTAGPDGDADYSNDGTQNLTISTGSTSTTFEVDISDDARHEDAETFEVEIYDAVGATISRSKAQVTINVDSDNPDAPQFRVNSASADVDEDAGWATVTVQHWAYLSEVGDITIPYTVVGITATDTLDFDATGGTVTFARGRLQTRTVRIPIVDDAEPEGNETFEVRFGEPSTGSFSTGRNKRVVIRAQDEPAQATAASISSSPASGSTYGAGETIAVSLAMSEAVRVTGRPYVVLDLGGTQRQAVYSGPIGSATDALEFSYTVQSGDFDANGVALCASGPACGSIQLDGGTIRAAADESVARLRHPALAAQSGHKVDAADPLPVPAPACSAEIEVPSDWALIPSGVAAGTKFRLLFVTSARRDARSTNIADYNSFVQARAANGHAAIQHYGKGFRVLGSTQTVNARANTCTQSSDTDAVVYWLNGAKAADDYADFYNGSWDSNADRLESGSENSDGTTRTWTGTDNDGTTDSFNALGGLNPAFTVSGSVTVTPLKLGITSNSSRYRLYGLSQIFVVDANRTTPATTDISIVSTPALGDSYRLGETVEVEVTYSETVTVRGTPTVGLSVKSSAGNYDNEYEAAYVRGSGTTKLVFSFTVPSGLKDTDGIRLHSDALRMNGATIVAVSDGLVPAWNLDAEKNLGGKVDSSLTLSVGICDRTPRVRDAIVAELTRVPGYLPNVSNCSQVTEAHLAWIDAELFVSGLTSIAAGDFAGLSGVWGLDLSGSGIETLPAGLFDGLESLSGLDVGVGLTHLRKDTFRELGKGELTGLYLSGSLNRFAAGGLPDGIFEPLTQLNDILFPDNVRTTADAGPGGALSAGQTVTLGGPGTGGGPWGSNVQYYFWDQTDGDGMFVSTVTLSPTDVADLVERYFSRPANPVFTVPVLESATDVKLRLRVAGRGDNGLDYAGHSTAEFTIRALAPTGVAVVSEPVDGSDTYKLGETIEFAVTFGDRVLVDTSLGTPGLTLTVGSAGPRASYVRGSGTNRLVFEHTVISSNSDTDGISVGMNQLALHGGVIASVYGAPAILDHAALAAQSGHKVAGSGTPALMGGICERTAQVRDKLLELVKAKPGNSAIANCSEVDPENSNHLAALTETLNLDGLSSSGLNGNRLTGLKAGDFAELTGITSLILANNGLRDIPAGVFDPLTALTVLNLSGNGTSADDGLTHLPAGLFDRLIGLTELNLRANDLSSLPPRIFEKLTNLTAGNLSLHGNPGTARFVPTAKAGPEGGVDVASGGSVTLEVEGPEIDDLWGNNVKYAWAPPAGTTVSYTDGTTANSPRPAFTAPTTGEDVTHVFRLTTTGGGGVAATSTVNVRVAAGPKVVEVAFASQPTGGNTPVYAAGETIEVAVRFDREVTVDTTGGTPSVTLDVGGASTAARYRDGSGSRALTFGYVVQETDTDLDGVDVVANSLALNGGEIAAVSDGGAAALGHEALAGGNGQTANGLGSPVTGGVCSRTPAVAAAIVERVDTGNNGLTCDDITDPQLIAITGRLDLSAQVSAHGRMTALKAGDFADLIKVTALDLDNHALRSFPAGIFGPLTALTELSIAYNQTQAGDRLRSLPAGLFDKLTNLTTLRLEHNDLETLPDRIFQPLENLTTLTLSGNPGSATFLPVAVAGPEGGIDAKAGEEEVSLGGDAAGPWGNNLIYSWVKAAGTTVDPSATNIQMPTLTAPELTEAATLGYVLTVTAKGTSLTATDSVTVRVAPPPMAAAVTEVTLSSTPIADSTYKLGETIQAAVAFSMSVTVTGTPQLALSVGAQTLQATYVQGTGTRRLVFEYTVQSSDVDSDGIAIAANSLALGTDAAIVDANGADAILTHAALAAQSDHKVDGSSEALTGGICGRTAQVRDTLLGLVRTNESDNTLTCAQVTEADLAALTGIVNLRSAGIATLKRGDFANLGGITSLQLFINDLTALPAGVFEGLDDTLTSLHLNDNDLQTIPAGVFDRLTGLEELQLHANDFSSLPPRIFEKLTSLAARGLSINLNPGTARFKPTAKAGPEGGIDVPSGGSVTLGVEPPQNGYDDLWGINVTYSWSRTAGTGGTLTDTMEAQATFTAPAADGTHTFTLTVTGGGGIAATSTVHVRVGTAAMPPMPESAVVDGGTLTLTYGQDLQEIDPAPASGKGQVYLAVVSEPGARRNIETARPSKVKVKGRQVILTLLDPPADFGDTVTLSYYSENATAESRVRGLGGILAASFAGLRVRNETPGGNTPRNFAFTGPAKTYRIGDTIGIEVTFAEPVTVTGAPTLALEIGAASRKAVYVRGSGSAVLTFEAAAVALGEEDADGIAVEANGLEVPAGGSILNTGDREAAILRHGRYQDSAYKVDGVLPTATGAAAAGPTVTVTWSEALDEASVPTGAGGFTVRIGNANGPAVSAVGVSGSTTTLSLASAIADGTANVTLEYTQPRSGAKIRDAAGNDAAAILRADALAVTVRPDTRAPEISGMPTVDGATLTLTFDEALDTASVPAAPGGFTATVTRGGNPVSGYTVSGLSLSGSGTVLTLTLSQAVRGGDAVTLAYAKPTTPLQDRASTPNEVADFSGQAVDNLTPSVKGAPVFAGAAQAYAIGDRIAVEVEFTEAVSVTTTSTARPEVDVEVGANTRKARYVSGSGSARLRFEYEIVAGDADTDGIAIPADALAAPTGSAIRTSVGNRAVQFAHDAVGADAARTVDGVRPTATAAAAAGPTVTVTWSKALDEASVPTGAGGFTVRIGNANGPAVTAVGVSESTTTLSLASAIADGTANVTLEYTPPRSGAKIRDAAGNDAAAILRADALAVTVRPDTRAPEISGMPTVDGATLTLTFDEALDTASVPAAPGGFTATVTRGGNPVSGYTVSGLSLSGSGTVLTLTLSQAVRGGDAVMLAYAKPTPPLQDRASTPNEVADFSGQAVDNLTPSVKGAPVFAGAAQAYAIGDRIAVEVEFTEAVSVTTTSTARPEVDVEVGANTRKARYVSGSGSARLRFEYEIVAGDADTDGIAIPADALAAPTGSAIRTSVGNRAVQFAHDAVAADAARTVDGVRPTATAAAAAGQTVTVTWSKALDEASVPTGAGGFTVRIGNANGPAVTAVGVSGSTTTLSLASAIADGTANVTLEYTPPGSGAKIRDAAGNDAAAILRADALAVTVRPDTRAPEISGMPTVDGATLTLTFDEALDTASVPAVPGGFTATVTRGGNTVSGYTVSGLSLSGSGTVLTLTLSQAVRGGDAVTLAYAKPTTPLQDRASTPNEVADFSGQAVDNLTPSVKGAPVFAGAAQAYAIGDRIAVEVEFTEAVSVTTTSTARPEVDVEVGANTRKARYVSGSGSARLRFEYEIVAGDADTDGIAIPADALAAPTGSAIRTSVGNRAVQFAHDAVGADAARTVDGVRPTATAAAAAGPTVTVTWSEALDPASLPTGAGGFTVRIGNANGPAVTAVGVSGSTTTLSLASAIADGTANVTLEYTPPGSGAKIRDAAGNDAAAILRADALAVTVRPDTRAPEISGMPTVDGATLTLTFDEALDTASVPAAPGGFTATVTRGGNPVSGYTVSGLSLSGTVLTLTLSRAVRGGDAVTLAYAKPTTPLQDRASTPNEVADFSGQAVDNLTPSVKGAPVFAGAAQAYAIGDRIAVEVEFTEAVSVTTTSTARPEVDVEVGAHTRKARYVSGSGSARLRFEYEIVAGDADTDGIAIPADALAAPTGSAIRTSVGNRAVQFAHDAVGADPARTVDGVRPTATAAAAAGQTVTVTWSEALDEASVPTGAGGFTVRIGNANGPAVTAVGVSESTTTLSLASAIADGTANVTLEYTPPGSGAKIRDAAGNDAAAILRADALAVTVRPDTRAPEISGMPTVEGATLTLTFDEALDTASVPAAPGGFTATVTRGGNPVSGYTVSGLSLSGSGTVLTLTLSQAVRGGDAVTLAYTKPTTPLRDRAVTPNDVAAFSGQSVDNETDALAVSLSTTEAVEGDDGTVTLTVAVAGGGTSGVARAIGIAPVASPTAAETEDWTLTAGQRSLTLGAGQRSVSAAIAVVDDARLEGEETVSFAVTADGTAIGQVTLTIADDDRAVLAVTGPAQPVTEGGAIELTLRLEPHPDTVANAAAVPDDACILDFPVTATLTRAGDTAALPSGAALETTHTFAATGFEDCTREVTVSVPTKASDGVWMADRGLTLTFAPQAGSDPRVEAGEPLQATVHDDTPPPGPLVTSVAVSPLPAEASDEHGPRYTKEEFLALPDKAVHGQGATLSFTLTFDSVVTVTPDSQTRALPELVLDVFGRERRALLSGDRTDTGTLTFHWTVGKGDNDPDGIRITSIDLKGAGIRFAAGCMQDLPCDMDAPNFKSEHAKRYPKHRVRGGLHAMRLSVSGSAREGEPFTLTVRRNGGYEEPAHAIVRITDSGVESPAPGEESAENHGVRLMLFPFDADPEQGPDSRVSVQTVTPPGDGVADARTLTLQLFATDVNVGGVSYWYVTGNPVEAAVADTGLAGSAPDGPSLGVWDAWTREPTQEQWDRGTRFPLLFDVTVPWPNVLRPRGDATVTVDYETRNGTAVADSDYVAQRGTLTFLPGETRKTVEVEVMADRHDEGEETMTLVLSNATGAALERAEAVGTIRNNGPIPKAWIARFGRTVAEQVLEAVEGRMRAAPAPGAEVVLAGERIGGQPEPGSEEEREARREEESRRDAQRLADWLISETDPEAAERRSRAVTPRDLLTGSSFALIAETAGKDLVSLWSRGAVTRFDGREGDLILDGEVVTGMLGADWTRERWTAGLIVSHSTAEGGYSGAPEAGDAGSDPGSGSGTGGKVEATLTGLFPWARHALSERLEVWGAAGYGQGELTVTPKKPGTDEDGAAIRADLDLRMAAAGLRGTILDPGSGSGTGGGFWGGLTLTGKTDAMAVQTASGRGRGANAGNLEPARATVTRLRLGLEASRPVGLGPGSGSGAGGGTVLTPRLEIGVRHDGGDAETGVGLDLGGGLALADPKRGLQAELRGRGLLAHQSKGFRDLGFSGSLAWEGKPGSDRGARLRLTQAVGGSSAGGADALLARTTLEGLAANDNPGSGSGAGGGNDELKSRRLELKFGYGLSAFSDRFTWTPEAGVGLSDTGRDYSLGWRLVRGRSGSDGGSFELSFEARRRESANDDTPPEHEIGLRLTARW